MQNHWQGIHSDKIWVERSTKNTLKLYLKILFGRSAQSAKIFGIFGKKHLLGEFLCLHCTEITSWNFYALFKAAWQSQESSGDI